MFAVFELLPVFCCLNMTHSYDFYIASSDILLVELLPVFCCLNMTHSYDFYIASSDILLVELLPVFCCLNMTHSYDFYIASSDILLVTLRCSYQAEMGPCMNLLLLIVTHESSHYDLIRTFAISCGLHLCFPCLVGAVYLYD